MPKWSKTGGFIADVWITCEPMIFFFSFCFFCSAGNIVSAISVKYL